MGLGDVASGTPRQRAQLADVLQRTAEVRVAGTNEGIVSEVSPMVTTQLGWRPEEMVGHPIVQFVHPDDHEALATAQAGLLAGRPQQFPLRLRRTDDTYARMAISIRPVFDDHNNVIGRVGAWRLVDERPWLADPLDDRALRFVAEHTSEALLLVSPDRYLLWSTAAIHELLAWKAEDVFDRDLGTFLHPDDLSAAMPHLEGAFRQQDPVTPRHDLIVRLAAAAGGHRWVSLRIVPLTDADGHLVGVVVSIRKVDDLFGSRQQLAAERARVRATVESVLDPHVTLTPIRDATGAVIDLVIADANPAACASQGIELGDLLGQRLSELAPLAWPTGLFARLVAAIENGSRLTLERFLYAPNSDGSERRYDVRAVATAGQLTCSWRDVGRGPRSGAARTVRIRRRRR